MDDLLKMAAEARGMPESLVKRSAEARAKAEGISLEAVLAEWAGVEVPAGGEADAAPPEPPTAPEAAVDETPDVEEPEPDVEVLEPAAPAPAEEAKPAPRGARVAGMKRYPVWLTATFLIVPLIAVLYILVVPNGPQCGSAGQLLVDPVSGEAVGCDGAPYGVETVDNFSIGQALYQANCTACHGDGGGGGAGPALAGGAVLATFPAGSCTDHVTWISLGSAGWASEVGPTYGATDKPVGGSGVQMPGFGTALSEEELAQVAVYERVAFGGSDLVETESDCGLGAGEGGETTALGS